MSAAEYLPPFLDIRESRGVVCKHPHGQSLQRVAEMMQPKVDGPKLAEIYGEALYRSTARDELVLQIGAPPVIRGVGLEV